jgi:hypothetical protein
MGKNLSLSNRIFVKRIPFEKVTRVAHFTFIKDRIKDTITKNFWRSFQPQLLNNTFISARSYHMAAQSSLNFSRNFFSTQHPENTVYITVFFWNY